MALVVLIVCRGLDESWLINQNDIHAKLLSWVWLHFFGHVREKLLYVCAVHMWAGHFFLWSLFTNVSTYFLNCRDIGSWEELLESSLSILLKKPNLGVSFGNYWRCSVHIFTTADWWNMHTFLLMRCSGDSDSSWAFNFFAIFSPSLPAFPSPLPLLPVCSLLSWWWLGSHHHPKSGAQLSLGPSPGLNRAIFWRRAPTRCTNAFSSLPVVWNWAPKL